MLNFNLLSILFIFTSLITIFLSIYAYNRRNVTASLYLNLLMAAVSIWSFFYGIELASNSISIIKICLILEYFGIANVSVLWFLYASYYTGKADWITPRVRNFLFVVPITTIIMLVSNQFHGLYYSSMELGRMNGFSFNQFQPGIFYWIHIGYSYLMVAWGTILFFRFLFDVSKENRKKVSLIIFAGLVPYFISIAYVFGFKPYGFVDPTPFGFFIMSAILTYGALSSKLFDITPIAMNSLFDSLDDAVFVVDLDWQIVSANPSAKLLFETDILKDNKNIVALLRDDYKVFEGLSNNKNVTEVEIENKNFKVTVSPLNNDKGVFLAKMIVLSDITKNIQIRKDLSESEIKYQYLFENLSNGFALHEMILDSNGKPVDYRFLEVNSAFERLTGLRREDIIGKTCLEVLPQTEYFWIETYGKVVMTGIPITFDNYSTVLNKHYQVTAYTNEQLKFATVFIDITERKKTENKLQNSEEKFRKAFLMSPDCVTINRFEDGTYLLANKGFFETFGYAEEEIIGRTTIEKNIWNNLAERQIWVDEIKKHGEVKNLIFRFIKKNKEVFYGLVSSTYVELDGEKHVLSITRDITDKIKVESELEYQIELQNLLVDLSNGFINLPLIEIENKISEALRVLGLFVGVDRSSIFHYDVVDQVVTNIQEWCADDVKPQVNNIQNGVSEIMSEWYNKHCSGETIIIQNVDTLESGIVKEWLDSQSIKSLTAVPMMNGNECIGFVRLDSVKTHHFYTAAENKLLTVFAQMLVNIEVRKQSDIALRNSQASLSVMIKTIPDLIWVKDIEGKYIICNSEFEKFFGASEVDIVGKTDYDFMDNELAEFFRQHDKNALKAGKPTVNEEWITYANDGHKAYLETIKTPICDPAGNIIGVLGIGRDITDRTIADENLRKSEDRFRNFFEHSLVGKSITTVDGKLRVNKVFCDIVGYTEEELNNIHWSEITHEEDIDLNIKYLQSIENGESNSVQFEKRYIHKTGKIVWVDLKTTLIYDEHLVPMFYISEINDITERKRAEEALRESEEKFRTLFTEMTEIAALYSLVYDEQGNVCDYKITDCNKAFTTSLNYTRNQVVGKLASELYGQNPPPNLDDYARVCLTGETYTFDTYSPKIDRYFQVSVVSPGTRIFATIATDFTDLKRFNDVLIDKNREMESYVYITSHDLRSPLVNIQGFSARLKKQTDALAEVFKNCALDNQTTTLVNEIIDNKIPKTLDFVFNNVSKMESLLNSLLQISRTGRMSMSIVPVDISRLVGSVVKSADYQLNDIGAKVVIGDLPDCYGDENLLNQLFSNIIGNAIKYRDDNRKLIINIKGEKQFNKVVYSVKDNGMGIPQFHLEKIWNVFYRVDVKQTFGDGIGLSIAKRIVDKHKGRIWVESVENKGSTFYIELMTNVFTE